MSSLDLRTILISDFRSIRGRVAIPLNAPVVLLHGTNGAGKSTVMSAIELALTGNLSGIDAENWQHLIHRGAGSARIELVGSSGATDFVIEGSEVRGAPLLDSDDARFLAERCYLQQRTLGRLLEMYEKPANDGESPLTAFVKDLLGLDELDALIDGLYPVTDKRRVKRLVPQYGDLDRDLEARTTRIAALRRELEEAIDEASSLGSSLAGLLEELGAPAALTGSGARQWLSDGRGVDERTLSGLIGTRQELMPLVKRAKSLAMRPGAAEIAALEADAASAHAAADAWRTNHGSELEALLDLVRDILPGVPAAVGPADPEAVRLEVLEQVRAELARLMDAIAQDEASQTRIVDLERRREVAAARLSSIDDQLAASSTATAAEDLGRALASLVPHVHSDECPVCGRDFAELSAGPLSARLAARISDLAAQAERLQRLAEARVQALSDLRRIESERAALVGRRVKSEAMADMRARAASLQGSQQRLERLAAGTAEGAGVIRRETEANRALTLAREQDRSAADLRAAAETLVAASGFGAVDPTSSIVPVLDALTQQVTARAETTEARLAKRHAANGVLDALVRVNDRQQQLEQTLESEEQAEQAEAAAIAELERRRSVMRDLRTQAEEARVSVVRRVFTNSLNRAWRDLFVRLAPEEPFVPAFQVPDRRQRVMAALETVHRDGRPGGSPAAMLSAGNLNTAALTLFLALNLSVRPRLPWLLLDDPVQSMDEVHVAQFAALLRTLTREQGRRVLIAVHERALFDYLSLELSPASPDDGLVTVELSRTPDGSTAVEASYQAYVEDRALEPV